MHALCERARLATLIVSLVLAAAACGGTGGHDDGVAAKTGPRVSGLAASVRARISVGSYPESIVTGFGSVWVTKRDGGITEIDPAANRPVRRIADASFYARSIVAGAGSLWAVDVTSETTARLERVDPRSGAVEASLPVDFSHQNPVQLLFADAYVWLMNGNDGNLYKIDPRTNAVEDRVKVATRSSVVSVAFAGGSVWTGSLEGPVTRVDPRAMDVVGRVSGLTAVRLAGDDVHLWAAELGGGLARVDTETTRVARRVDVGSGEEFRLAVVGSTLWARSDTTLYARDARTGAVRRTDRIPRARMVFGMTAGFGSLWLVRGTLGQVWRLPLRASADRRRATVG